MIVQSEVTRGPRVAFPSFTGERIYMRAFEVEAGLPSDLSRWQETVDGMLAWTGVRSGRVYLMVDQARVAAGAPHRRPGVHVDGYWNEGASMHGTPSPGHSPSPGRHGPQPLRPGHGPARLPGHGPSRLPGHGPVPSPGHRGPAPGSHFSSGDKEGLFLASTVTAARAFVGEYELPEWQMGDCSSVDTSSLKPVILEAGNVYTGHAMYMLHESLPVPFECERTLVRLNVPGWAP